MIASITESTRKQYIKPLELWWKFCTERQLCPFTAPTLKILEFLGNLFEKFNSYGTLNTYRSAISLININKVGEDENIKRYCKGVSVLKPQKPKYNYTWDPKTVLNYLSTLYPNESLSLDKLSKKLVTLLA